MNTVIGSGQISGWTKYTIRNINVPYGQIEVGIWYDANAGIWAVFDNMELVRQ